MKYLYILLFSLPVIVVSQNKKSYTIKRTDTPPKIDGILDDSVWKSANSATNFVEFRPTLNKTYSEEQQTTVKLTYDDKAIYIAGYLKDNPKNMMQQFLQRDAFGQSDFFCVIFNPNNDAQNDTEFFVFSSGSQADAISNPDIGEDFGWNAVWESATKILDDGWTLEMKIPYAALRFSNNDKEPTWGIQFHRHFRKTRQQSTWSPLNPSKGYIGLYNGELTGLKNIKPPVRLSFYPFTSAIINRFENSTTTNLNAGLDIKYGLTENFTIDATLIPDFSQAAFDNVELNLGPFEQQFSEQRQFFKEGIDLFSKGNLFYSRRIGGKPVREANLNDNEKIIGDPPNKVNMLNAIKLSGRTKKALGIGVFNAITQKTTVTIADTITNKSRKEVVEPFANYNILVFDKQFNKNSSVSLINTNVTRKGDFRDGNVTGVLLDLNNKKNTHGFRVNSKISNVRIKDSTEIGLSSGINFSKNSGKYRYYVQYDVADKNYDINDFGIQFRNNFKNIGVGGSYRIFKPTKHNNNFWSNVWLNYNMLHTPNVYSSKNFGGDVGAVNKKTLAAYGGSFNVSPGKQYDYFGPREEGRFFIREDRLNMDSWISTDYNKTFAFDGRIGYNTLFEKNLTYNNYWYNISPRLKLKDKFVATYSFQYEKKIDERDYIDTVDDDIIYGQRDQITITNTISANYNFNQFHSLILSFRNYWSSVQYENNVFLLEQNGRLAYNKNYYKDTLEEDPDINFNTWNLNVTYSWQIAPGSFLTAQYRNSIFNSNSNGLESFQNSLTNLFNESFRNILSLKVVYFIDYNDAKNWLKSKKS